MIEHVMAALAGCGSTTAVVEIDAGECPGCDGSSRAFVEALDEAGIVEQDRMRQTLVVDRAGQRPRGGRRAGGPPAGAAGRPDPLLPPRLRPGSADPRPELLSSGLSAETFRDELAASRTFLLEAEAAALRAAGIGVADHRGRPPDLRPRRRHRQRRCGTPTSASGTRSSTWSATSPCWASTCTGSSSPTARATRPTPRWRAGCSRPVEPARDRRRRAAAARRGRHDRHRRDHEPPAPPLPVPPGRPRARARCRAGGWWRSRT